MNDPRLDLNRLHEQARRDAQRLRSEAIAQLWADLDHALDRAADSASSAALRLACRLRRWRHGRAVAME